MKKFYLLLMIFLSCTLTTSCWSRREIENLGFVMGFGISKTDEGLYTVVVQVANPNAIVADAPIQREAYTIMEAQGLTVFDAVRNLSMIAGRRVYIAHIQALLIHENIAKEGLNEVIGFWYRTWR